MFTRAKHRRRRPTLARAMALAIVAAVMFPVASQAAVGSAVSGVVWADANRDSVKSASEAVRSGVVVQLLASPAGTLVASTTTAANGTYSFANVADGDYVVRIDAPGPFTFPVAASGGNAFSRAGDPAPGQPERGVTAPFTISGATKVAANAALQPVADLHVEKIPIANACDGYATTGTAPFTASDGPGLDSGPSNCIVRVNDTVAQNYSVALTGLPTGVEVPNVVAEFTISSTDGAKLALAGPGANGLPAGCLQTSGVSPASSVATKPDGSLVITCNVGKMSSNVAAIQVLWKFAGATPIPAHAQIITRAYAAGGDAGASNTLSGPVIEVTGTADWDISKYVPDATNWTRTVGPSFTVLNVGGVDLEGYQVRFRIDMKNMFSGPGAAELTWPVTFTDKMPEFPSARVTNCRATDQYDPGSYGGVSPWTLTCPPVTQLQGASGWQMSVKPNSGVGADTNIGHMELTVFVPLAEMNKAIDPTWQPGNPPPTGTFNFTNAICDTDHWAINGGALNYGDGHEPGWDCSGNNVATMTATAKPSQWDLQKSFNSGPSYTTRTIDGQQVNGYLVNYNMQIIDLAGQGNVAPWLDRPVTFKDRLVSHPGAYLTQCWAADVGGGWTNGAPTCETGLQPADGWDMSWSPTQLGFDMRRGNFYAQFFIPLDAVASDPCQSNVTLDLWNEAIDSDSWAVQGSHNVNALTGHEPGWDGTTATGNNVAKNKIRPAAGDCGSMSGDKRYSSYYADPNVAEAWHAGSTQTSTVFSSANNNRVHATDLRMCDVFDVSTLRITPGQSVAFTSDSAAVKPADYVIEYAIGPNQVDTQAGPFNTGANLYPVDSSSNQAAITGCRTYPGPWSSDPSTFGPDWRDRVNMVRVRPIDPATVAVGPFNLQLVTPLQARTRYNGGPDAGQLIANRVRITNEGGWPTGADGSGWATVERQRRYEGPLLAVTKTVNPTSYVPGDQVVWDLNVTATQVIAGMTMQNVRVVDSVPDGLFFDLTCTQNLLPAGVTVSYDPGARKATFNAGDIPITTTGSQQGLFNSSTATAPKRLRICTTVDTLAQPGDTYKNSMQAFADNAYNAPTADATITVVGSGQMGISKSVDKPYVASGDTYTWSIDWGNTSTALAFQAPDVIDVLPWNGDKGPGSLSPRAQYGSDYQGLARLAGPLSAPTYLRGASGSVAGTWYYATAAPATINQDSRVAVNDNPQTPGGLWKTAAEITDFGQVTAVRFVSGVMLPTQSRVRARIPMVSTSSALDNIYVNRATIFSSTFPNQLLLSNEPIVQMPGFTIGDLVWLDNNGDGRFSDADTPMAGVTVEVLDGSGQVVRTAITNAAGRWSVAGLPPGSYRARIPKTMFGSGAALAGYWASSTGSLASNVSNEKDSNDNTAATNPASTGVTSTPITLAYRYDGSGVILGGNGPTNDDVAGLVGPLVGDEFSNMTLDLALSPPAAFVLPLAGGRGSDPFYLGGFALIALAGIAWWGRRMRTR